MTFTAMSEAIEAYDEFLDELHGSPMGFEGSRIMRELDPIAYRCGFADYMDAEGVDTDELEDDEDLP